MVSTSGRPPGEAIQLFAMVALDERAAEGLGELQDLLADVAEPDVERTVFLWGGAGPAPGEADYWDIRFPAWTTPLPLGGDREPASPVPRGPDLDRQAVAGLAREAIARGAGRPVLDSLSRGDHTPHVPRNTRIHTRMVVACSLADPDSGARLLGLLRGVADLRDAGAADRWRVHVACLTGARARPREGDPDEEVSRALAARGLLDLEALVESPGVREIVAGPILLLGEETLGGAASGDAEQSSLLALATFSLTRSLVSGHRDVAPGATSPFDGAATNSDTGLFASVGAYAVRSPVRRLAWLLAARFCGRVFKALHGQQALATTAECARLEVPEELESLLFDAEQTTFDHVWTKETGRLQIPWTPEAKQSGSRRASAFDVERLKGLYTPIFSSRSWERLIDVYGAERLRGIALEDWNGALDELQMAIESGFIPRREREVAEQGRRIAVALLEGVSLGLDSVFERAFAPPVGNQPHRAALAFLGRLRRAFESQVGRIEKAEAVSPSGLGRSRAAGRSRLPKHRARLTEALAAVPSPAAVLLRLLPVAAISFGAALSAPLGSGPVGSPLARLGIGLLLALAGGATLFLLHVDGVRRRLFHLAVTWIEQYRQVLSEEDDLRKRNSHRAMCQSMVACLEWFLSGTGDTPPLPSAFVVRLDRPEAGTAKPPKGLTDLVRPQEALGAFSSLLATAAERFEKLESRLLGQFQASRLETLLPATAEQIASDFARAFGGAAAGRPGDDLDQLTALDVDPVAPTAEGLPDPVRPFKRVDPDRDPSVPGPVWRRPFALPEADALLDVTTRTTSSAFGFLEAARRLAEARLDVELRLSTRLNAVLAGAPLHASSLWQAWTGLSVPSLAIPVPNVPVLHSIVASGPDDPLAADQAGGNDLGRGRISVHCQVQPGLSATAILEHPTRDNPSSRLGRAWNRQQAHRTKEKAFLPTRFDDGGSR